MTGLKINASGSFNKVPHSLDKKCLSQDPRCPSEPAICILFKASFFFSPCPLNWKIPHFKMLVATEERLPTHIRWFHVPISLFSLSFSKYRAITCPCLELSMQNVKLFSMCIVLVTHVKCSWRKVFFFFFNIRNSVSVLVTSWTVSRILLWICFLSWAVFSVL